MSKRTCAIAFDAFGTLLDITERRNPYSQFMNWMQDIGRDPRPNDAARIMSQPAGLEAIAGLFGVEPPAALLARWNEDLNIELESIRPFSDTLPVIERLQKAGYRVGVCSNLASPYGSVVRKQLPSLDAYSLSHEIGAVKPEPAIYQSLIDQFGCAAGSVLFIGDTPISDVEGPRAFGMEAALINRDEGQTLINVLQRFGLD